MLANQAERFPKRDLNMRTYSRNSPQAAARIVALVLIADGHVDRREEQMIEKLGIDWELGIAPTEFMRIVQTLCEDCAFAHAPSTRTAGQIDRTTLGTLLAEIDDPVLRRKTIRLCMAVAAADDFMADGEIAVLAAVLNAWIPPSNAAFPPQARAAAVTCEASE